MVGETGEDKVEVTAFLLKLLRILGRSDLELEVARSALKIGGEVRESVLDKITDRKEYYFNGIARSFEHYENFYYVRGWKGTAPTDENERRIRNEVADLFEAIFKHRYGSLGYRLRSRLSELRGGDSDSKDCNKLLRSS